MMPAWLILERQNLTLPQAPSLREGLQGLGGPHSPKGIYEAPATAARRGGRLRAKRHMAGRRFFQAISAR